MQALKLLSFSFNFLLIVFRATKVNFMDNKKYFMFPTLNTSKMEKSILLDFFAFRFGCFTNQLT